MRLSNSIERQLARIERGVAELTKPHDAEMQRILARAHERAQEADERYVECIGAVLGELDDEFYELVVTELNGAEWRQSDIRSYGEFGSNNGLSTLTNAVLSLAEAIYHERQIEPFIPPALCNYFLREPLEKFIYRSGGRGFRWLTSNVKCEVCAYPLPAESLLCGGLHGVQKTRDEPGECEVLPFKRCPCCDGPAEWSTKNR